MTGDPPTQADAPKPFTVAELLKSITAVPARKCSWCGTVMDARPARETSHSICPRCAEAMRAEANKQ